MALKYEDHGKLDYEAMYHDLAKETEGYKEMSIINKNTSYFIPLYCYLASCIAVNRLSYEYSLIQAALLALIPTVISVFILSVIKHFIEIEFAHYKKKYIPLIVHIALFVIIPVFCYFVF